MRRENGAAAVELALVGAILLLLTSGLLPAFQAVLAYNDLSRATAEALRYAVHAEANPRPGTGDCAGRLTRWPSAEEIRSHVEASLGRPVDTFAVDPASPCLIPFGGDRRVSVTASVDHDLGLLAGTANVLAGVLGGGQPFPDQTIQLTATATGLKE